MQDFPYKIYNGKRLILQTHARAGILLSSILLLFLLLLLRCVPEIPRGAARLGANLIGVDDVLRIVVDFHRFHLDHRLRSRHADHGM